MDLQKADTIGILDYNIKVTSKLLYAIKNKIKRMNTISQEKQLIALKKQYFKHWNDFVSSLPYHGEDIYIYYKDPTTRVYRGSDTLDLRDILRKTQKGLTPFSSTDYQTTKIRLDKVIEYVFYITFKYLEPTDLILGEYWTTIFECKVFGGVCLIYRKMFCLTDPYFTPLYIKDYIIKLKNRYMETNILKKPKESIYAPTFKLEAGEKVSKVTAEHRFEICSKWITDYFDEFTLEYNRTPTYDEVSSMIVYNCKQSTDKTLKIFTRSGVSRPTLRGWLQDLNLFDKLTRKSKKIELHLWENIKNKNHIKE